MKNPTEVIAEALYLSYCDGYERGFNFPGRESPLHWPDAGEEERERWREAAHIFLGEPVAYGAVEADQYGVDLGSLAWLSDRKLDPGHYRILILRGE